MWILIPHKFEICALLLGPYVLAWKKGIAVLSAGSVKVSPDPRVQLINGFNLEIRDVAAQDAGDYVCQIGTLQPREITHTLEVLGNLLKFILIEMKHYHRNLFTLES